MRLNASLASPAAPIGFGNVFVARDKTLVLVLYMIQVQCRVSRALSRSTDRVFKVGDASRAFVD